MVSKSKEQKTREGAERESIRRFCKPTPFNEPQRSSFLPRRCEESSEEFTAQLWTEKRPCQSAWDQHFAF
jgi:hypothetical protein